MGGLGKLMPITMALFTIGGLSMVGLPLLAGFVTKLVLGRAALAEGIPQWQMVTALAAIAVSSLLNAWYYLPTILQIWKGGDMPEGPDSKVPEHGHSEPGRAFRIAVLCMSLVVVLLGCFAEPFMRLIAQGVSLL